MSVEIKFCGLTRREDAELAVELNASYTGVIFAGGPRQRTVEQAMDVLAVVPRLVSRVGVFGDQPAAEIARVADWCQLNVVQLHGAFSHERIAEIRRDFEGDIWSVCRVEGISLPDAIDAMIEASDGILLDAMVPGKLGGTGVTIPWADLSKQVQRVRARKKLILAGGLRPENVAEAIGALSPDVVDVSSGVESAPGIKDASRMRAFRDAVNQISTF